MFLSRLSYEALVRENARLAASCDWLAEHVTQLERERAILLERVLEVQIPVMSIAREARPTARPPDTLTPKDLANLEMRFAPPPSAAPGTVYRPPPSVADAEAVAAMAIFEDAGNEIADRLGAGWGPDGELTFSK